MICGKLKNWSARLKSAVGWSEPALRGQKPANESRRHSVLVNRGIGSFALALIITQTMPRSCPVPKFPQIAFSPTSLVFPAQVVNPTGPASPAQMVTLTNSGTADLSTTGLTASGDFSQTNDCPADLAPNASCNIQVTFSANAVGGINGAITLTESSFVSLTGTGLSPVGFSPANLDFGTIAPGTTSAAQAVTLTNNQDTALTITNISTSGNYSKTDNCPASLAQGQTCTINVTFSPTISGSIPGALTVVTDAALGTQPVGLSGVGDGSVIPNLSFSPATLQFGNLEAGTTSASRTVTLTNTSASASLTVNTVGTSSGNYNETDTCAGQIIPAGGSCTINVSFKPTANLAPISYPAAITVSDSDATSPHVVGISGTAVASISASADTVSFGTVYNGSDSTAQTVTLTNNDSSAEDLSIAIGGGYLLSSNNCPSSLSPGATCDLGIQKTSGGSGVANSAVTLTPGSGGFLSPHVVSLSACSTSVLIAPQSLNFGGVGVGSTSDAQVATLINGGSALNISDISIAGTNAAQFAISRNTCGTVLPSNQACILETTFTPASSGTKTASLSITDDASCSPQQIALSGGSSSGPFTLTLASQGNGTVTSSPAGINCNLDSSNLDCTASFASGTSVTLTAAPGDDQNPFVGWFGACTGTASCVLDMASDKQVTAVFGAKPSLSVSFQDNGSGRVTSTPAGIDCGSTCAVSVDPGTVVSLSAAAAAGSSFGGWSGACQGTGDCSVTVLSSQSAVASFTKPDFSFDASSALTPDTVAPGQFATSTLTIGSLHGFSDTVTLSCSVDPSPNLGPACSLNPSSTAPAADGSVASTVTVTTVPQSSAVVPHGMASPGMWYSVWLPLAALAWVGVGVRRKSGRNSGGKLSLILLCVLLLEGVISQTACGGGSQTHAPTGGTPAGTYNVTVTAKSGSLSPKTVVLPLTVN